MRVSAVAMYKNEGRNSLPQEKLESTQNVKILKAGFAEYINANYPHFKDKSVIYSDAFYPYRQDIGINFWDIFQDVKTIKSCQDSLQSYFIKNGIGKNPSGNSSVYMRSIKLLKEYIDHEYGSIDGFLNNSEKGNKIELLSISSEIPRETELVRRPSSININQPNCDEVDRYLMHWDSLENYSLQENALNKLFFRTYPNNSDINDILIKVSALNDFYSTNIFSPFYVAKHILSLDIDERLAAGDVSLVNEISKVTMPNGTVKNFYSFASKYCSHHQPLEYPIYDSYVDQLLRYFRDKDRFSKFRSEDLREYIEYKRILLDFRKFYRLDQFNIRELDKYLWQLGKEKFSRKY